MAEKPTIKVTENDPGQPALPMAGIAMSIDLRYVFEFKDTRDEVRKQVVNCVKIPLVDRAAMLARLEAMHMKHRLIRLTAVCSPHGAGSTFTFTIDEVN